MAIIEIEQLEFTYPEGLKPILQEINLQIEKGEFVVLCGTSGCGKSTLLQHCKEMVCLVHLLFV